MTIIQQIVIVGAGVAATMLTRFIPFLVFRPGKPTPRYVTYLGKVLPASVFAMLVVYCLRHIVSIEQSAHGGWTVAWSADAVAQIVAVALTFIVHLWRKSIMWSMAAGTLCYMLLIRLL